VARYRRLEQWDERLAEIRAQVQAEADYDLAAAMAENLKLVRSYKAMVAEALDSKTLKGSDVTASELEKVIRLESFVLGGSESRHEIVGRFDSRTDEE
jgi:hypothetical protein